MVYKDLIGRVALNFINKRVEAKGLSLNKMTFTPTLYKKSDGHAKTMCFTYIRKSRTLSHGGDKVS